jgi:hypothetical protein
MTLLPRRLLPSRPGDEAVHRGKQKFETAAEEPKIMNMLEMKWSKTEKEAARRAFERAYRKECAVIAAKIREMAASASGPEDLWRIHDLLTRERRQTDEKYDYRYSVLLFVFARLLNEGWVAEADLQGLADDKIEVIRYLETGSAGYEAG